MSIGASYAERTTACNGERDVAIVGSRRPRLLDGKDYVTPVTDAIVGLVSPRAIHFTRARPRRELWQFGAVSAGGEEIQRAVRSFDDLANAFAWTSAMSLQLSVQQISFDDGRANV